MGVHVAINGFGLAELPWRDLGVGVVIESSGRFRARADACYENEWGYSNRLVDLAQLVLAPVAVGS
jgi:glyceraldehyde-3-phosphate dehydrogenase/erythrose-4-phosphate dehydrogenase